MELLWCTDTHLDCTSRETRNQWLDSLQSANVQSILITGDISDGNHLINDLKWLTENLYVPIYFVLGNHDYYHSDFATIHTSVEKLVQQYENLIWLDIANPVFLDSTVLIGQSGWGDGRNGNFLTTPVRVNDHRLIADFANKNREEILSILQLKGTLSGDSLLQKLNLALQGSPKRIIVATHVPPFAESAWHNEQWGTYEWLPDFTCKAIGDTLLKFASENPSLKILVLCGHGHSPGKVQMTHNLVVRTGGAIYESPSIADIISV